jgi:hypothetical protein
MFPKNEKASVKLALAQASRQMAKPTLQIFGHSREADLLLGRSIARRQQRRRRLLPHQVLPKVN